MKRRGESTREDTDRWLLTYADLITLLLGFFVLMYAMSQIDAKKFGRVSEGLHGVFHGGDSFFSQDTTRVQIGSGVLKLGRLKLIQQRVKRISDRLGKERVSTGAPEKGLDQYGKLSRKNEPAAITTEINERGLVIHILESALFESGKADLKLSAEETLNLIANEIKGVPNHVRVEGHTDDRPISTFRFPSNWELSSARATAVVRFLTDRHSFPSVQISALGYGEYRPLSTNSTSYGRAKNRRVDIVVLTEELSRLEPATAATDSGATTAGNILLSEAGN